ncbi:MAG: hypothetical protein M1829_002587 [Trizodia sp. TS-e1964]|nr:MAG: hypothetical protein M1829_002587 [Trizodia sp. TS-e1964]
MLFSGAGQPALNSWHTAYLPSHDHNSLQARFSQQTSSQDPSAHNLPHQPPTFYVSNGAVHISAASGLGTLDLEQASATSPLGLMPSLAWQHDTTDASSPAKTPDAEHWTYTGPMSFERSISRAPSSNSSDSAHEEESVLRQQQKSRHHSRTEKNRRNRHKLLVQQVESHVKMCKSRGHKHYTKENGSLPKELVLQECVKCMGGMKEDRVKTKLLLTLLGITTSASLTPIIMHISSQPASSMAEQIFLDSLQDLTGRVAIVTGGGAGIGLETTIYLASKGATVYVASRNPQKTEAGIIRARERIGANAGSIIFHPLDLSSIKSATHSAREFKKIEARLDILICNAGICMTSTKELSSDGYEKMFATNHLGHFAFVNGLTDLLEGTATSQGEARIVITSSYAYKMASKLNYENLQRSDENDGNRARDLTRAFRRYGDSKLANIYFARELDRRFRQKGVQNIYCNTCHPGTVASTGLGAGAEQSIPPIFQRLIRKVMNVFSNSLKDAAKTQVYLATSRDIRNNDVHGEFWMPVCSSWTRGYQRCQKQELLDLGRNELEEQKLWIFSEKAINEANH